MEASVLHVPTEAEVRSVIGYGYDQDYDECLIEKNEDGSVSIRFRRMYEYVKLNLQHAADLARLVGVDLDHVDTDQDSAEGCETCDYGSRYDITYRFRLDG